MIELISVSNSSNLLLSLLATEPLFRRGKPCQWDLRSNQGLPWSVQARCNWSGVKVNSSSCLHQLLYTTRQPPCLRTRWLGFPRGSASENYINKSSWSLHLVKLPEVWAKWKSVVVLNHVVHASKLSASPASNSSKNHLAWSISWIGQRLSILPIDLPWSRGTLTVALVPLQEVQALLTWRDLSLWTRAFCLETQ